MALTSVSRLGWSFGQKVSINVLSNATGVGPPARPEFRRFEMFVTQNGQGREKDRCLYRLPVLAGVATYVSCRDTIHNAATALLERVATHEIAGQFVPPNQPLVGEVVRLLRPFRTLLKYYAVPSAPIPLLEYPATAYSGPKLALYDRAARKVAVTGVLAKYSYLSTFLKHEKLPSGGKRVVPRVIQPRKPEYNVSVGRYLHHVESTIYHDVARVYGQETIVKGYNAFQLGGMLAKAWSRFRDPAAVGLDASRFDQHVNTQLLSWEHSVYTGLYFPGYPELQTLLRYQLTNKGVVRCWDGQAKYSVSGGRCSGDMNTALGNCLLMTALIHTLLRENNLLNRDGTTRVQLFNNGDDCVLIGEQADITMLARQVAPFFARVGIIMKVEDVVRELEKISFCQTQPVFDGERWRVVRDVRQSFSKDCHALDYESITTHLNTYLYQIGSCGLALTAGLPVLQEYYLSLRRGRVASGAPIGKRLLESGFYRLSQGLDPTVRPVTVEARCSFARAFGIMPDHQVALESWLRTVDLTTLRTVSLEWQPTHDYI